MAAGAEIVGARDDADGESAEAVAEEGERIDTAAVDEGTDEPVTNDNDDGGDDDDGEGDDMGTAGILNENALGGFGELGDIANTLSQEPNRDGANENNDEPTVPPDVDAPDADNEAVAGTEVVRRVCNNGRAATADDVAAKRGAAMIDSDRDDGDTTCTCCC